MHSTKLWLAAVATGTLLGLSISPSRADLIFEGVSGNLDASATFQVSGNNLVVTLTNLSSNHAVYQPGDLLSGLFFDVAGSPTLVPVSAFSPNGVINGALPGCTPTACTSSTTDVGGEWGYQQSPTGFTGPLATTAQNGIAAAGYGGMTPKFGVGNVTLFGGTDLDGQAGLDGLDFSIAGNDYNFSNANGGAQVPLEENSVTFTWSGLPNGFNLDAPDAISNVSFGYGTNPDGLDGTTTTTNTDIPEPGTLLLLTTGLLALPLRRRR